MFVRYLFKTLRLVLFVTVFILFTRTFIIEPGRVNGRSMEPTYFDAQIFFVNKFLLLLNEPKRGQVIQLINPENSDEELLIKRIIALPGESVKISQNKVYIIDEDGIETELVEDYLPEGVVTLTVEGGTEIFPTIAENQYYVIGDNRPMSVDSRNFGAVDRSLIQGVVIR